MNDDQGEIELTVDEGIGVAHMPAPTRATFVHPRRFEALAEVVARVDADERVRVLIITGRGPGFCAGIEPTALMDRLPIRSDGRPDGALKMQYRAHLGRIQSAVTSIERSRVPVIAAIAGECGGAGLALACAADLRVASDGAEFRVREVGMAAVPDLGTLARLPGIVGRGVAREMVFTASPISAQRAHEFGLLNRVSPDAESLSVVAHELAVTIAQNPPLAVQGAKAVMNEAMASQIDRALSFVAAWNTGHIVSQDLGMAVAAAVTGERPEWGGR